LTREEVNAVIKKHLQARNVHLVCVTDDAEGLKQALVADGPSSITYAAEKPKELLEEDELIGARKLGIQAEDVRIVPVEEVFGR
jgi:zinc protease